MEEEEHPREPHRPWRRFCPAWLWCNTDVKPRRRETDRWWDLSSEEITSDSAAVLHGDIHSGVLQRVSYYFQFPEVLILAVYATFQCKDDEAKEVLKTSTLPQTGQSTTSQSCHDRICRWLSSPPDGQQVRQPLPVAPHSAFPDQPMIPRLCVAAAQCSPLLLTAPSGDG